MFFTLVLPGLGHLYAGAPRRALFLWLLSLLFGVVAVATLTILSATILPPVLVLVSGILASVLCPAPLQPLVRLHDSVSGVALLVQPRYLGLLHGFLQAYQIPNSSMEPTLLAGDYILARALLGTPSRGEIVIFQRRHGTWVKRLAGVPGDTLAMKAGVLSVNGHPVSEPYASQAHERRALDADPRSSTSLATPRLTRPGGAGLGRG